MASGPFAPHRVEPIAPDSPPARQPVSRTSLQRRWRRRLFVHLAALLVSMTGLAWLIANTDFLAVPVLLTTAIALQVLLLWGFLDSGQAMLRDVIDTMANQDFALRVADDTLDADLAGALNQVLERFANELRTAIDDGTMRDSA